MLNNFENSITKWILLQIQTFKRDILKVAVVAINLILKINFWKINFWKINYWLIFN